LWGGVRFISFVVYFFGLKGVCGWCVLRVDWSDGVFRRDKIQRILRVLAAAGGELRFGKIASETEIAGSTLNHNLNILVGRGVVSRCDGVVRLVYKTPLCFVFDSPAVRYAYLGLLGERGGREESETATAIDLLGGVGLVFDKVRVVTTFGCVSEWEGCVPGDVDWFLVGDEEIRRVNAMERRVEGVLEELMRDYVVIMDCTSATKPATIAFYKLANEYWVPLIYIYEKTRELAWIISREELSRRLLG